MHDAAAARALTKCVYHVFEKCKVSPNEFASEDVTKCETADCEFVMHEQCGQGSRVEQAGMMCPRHLVSSRSRREAME